MLTCKHYGFTSLVDGQKLNEQQRRLIGGKGENRACDPCDCNCNEAGDCNCRCN